MRGFANSFYSLTIGSCLAAGLAMGAGMFAAPGAAHADSEKRVALVIGNGAYKTAPHLDNPVNDARAMAEKLRRLGFEVVDGYDLDFSQMRKAIAKFSGALSDTKSAVVYYAGHGVSVNDADYLLPVDIELTGPADLDFSAIEMSMVLKQMKQEDPDGANIVFLDACRDNPFAEELHRSKTRAAVGPRGLSPISGELARGTLIAFATDPNSTAQDGVQGGHSPFTEALLNHLEDAGAPIDTVMTRVRTEVYEKTKHSQRPWVNTSLTGEFSFNPQAPAAPEAAAPGASAAAAPSAAAANLLERTEEKELWESAEHSNLGLDYQFYLEKYPNGMFATMARNRIASLSPATTTTRTPDDAPPPTPAGPSEKQLKAEVGTMETERGLHFGVVEHKEIQARLRVLQYYTGAIDGTFNEQTSLAIAEWQKKRQVAPTGHLGPVEVAALRAESEEMYQRYLDSQPEKPDAQSEKPDAQPENPQAAPSVPAPATGSNYPSYHYYQPYHNHYQYQPHYHAYHHYHHYYAGGGYSGGSMSGIGILRSFFHF
jgi:uncharacterized caspase-like protein